MRDLDYQAWVGKTYSVVDRVTSVPVTAMAATVDRVVDATPGTPLPPLWHWLYFLPMHSTSKLGPDGHAKRGGFLPPVTLPRRMWVGSRLWFKQSLKIDERVRRQSAIDAITSKNGRSGAFVLVTIRHQVHGENGLAIIEEQDLAYREAASAGTLAPTRKPPPTDPEWSHPFVPDPVLLFRYSALTFNGHRIHYDYPYVTEQEGYPDLVVHAPLTASLLLESLHREYPDTRISKLTMRAVRPLFANTSFAVEGKVADDGHEVELWTRDHEGNMTMKITADLANT